MFNSVRAFASPVEAAEQSWRCGTGVDDGWMVGSAWRRFLCLVGRFYGMNCRQYECPQTVWPLCMETGMH